MRYFFLFAAFLILFSCKKTEYEEVIITGNQAPPDSTISTLTKETYANKVYISLLGREPTDSERSSGLAILDKNELSQTNREEFISEVMAKSGYHWRVFELASLQLLEGNDTNEITEMIYIFEFLLTDSSYADAWPYINYELVRLYTLQGTLDDYKAGTIGIIEIHRRLIDNYFYDQINMGTENFVVSSFQHFLDRYPTAAELDQGTSMVDGIMAVLFSKTGNSKDDYMDVLFDVDNYFESQVRELYLRYLFREPTSAEMTEHAASYKSGKDYKALQKAILSLDEYVGV
ncbi:MAG: hypothetical protein COA57_10835 [Flavobacteriales bacterium]|nr:hypothetical protein [Bacteroidales bacterium AH-315-I05]PCJ83605.1 MAG: hypothetical protein COA57_10835 [Flavobacteriales bacterium]